MHLDVFESAKKCIHRQLKITLGLLPSLLVRSTQVICMVLQSTSRKG